MSETHETPHLNQGAAEPKALSPGYRLAHIVLYVVAFELSRVVAYVVTIVQFVLHLFTGHANDRLRSFGGSLSRYLRQVTAFLTYESDERPYPFSPWPRE